MNMRLKKFLALGLLIPALMLVGCTNGNNTNPTPNPTDSASPVAPTPKEWTADQLSAYYLTQQYRTTIDTYGQKINFTDGENGTSAGAGQATVAVWTVNQYIKNALDNGYFIANWWGAKDKYTPVGLEQVTQYTTAQLERDFATEVKTMSVNNKDATAWFDTHLFMPTTHPDYTVFDTCEKDWDMQACRYEEPSVQTYDVTRSDNGDIQVKVSVTVTPAYNQVIDGGPGIAPRVYDFTFYLTPHGLPPIVDSKVTSAEGYDPSKNDVDEKDLKPYYLIYNMDSKVTYGTPYTVWN
jgi:hypothetical protein